MNHPLHPVYASAYGATTPCGGDFDLFWGSPGLPDRVGQIQVGRGGLTYVGVDKKAAMDDEQGMSTHTQSIGTGAAEPGKSLAHARAISNWLLVVCAMVFVMIVLGGLTRLTHSGLSMVSWEPITGWLPPLNAQEWSVAYEGYKLSPEYLKINLGMTLSEFQGIFWLEFIHRLVGRSIGAVFLLPFIFFLVKGWVDRRVAPMLLFLFVLGGMQGVLGWYMVKSGLVDRPDVSQYRLSAHLGLAVLIYGVTLRYALRLRRGYDAVRPMMAARLAGTHNALKLLSLMAFVTIVSGGFVAGLDAGLIYNTFPFMDGQLIPDGLYSLTPTYLNAFEDIMSVQFNHRVLAIGTFVGLLGMWFSAQRRPLSALQQRGVTLALLAGWVQVGLGVATLITVVPVALGSIHQAGAVLLISALIYALHVLEWERSSEKTV